MLATEELTVGELLDMTSGKGLRIAGVSRTTVDLPDGTELFPGQRIVVVLTEGSSETDG